MVKINTDDENYGFYSGDYYDPLNSSGNYEAYQNKAQGKSFAPDKNDPIPLPKKDKDKNKGNGKDDKKFAIRKLTRNDKGLLEVKYINPDNGKAIQGSIRGYTVLSSETELKDILKEAGFRDRRDKKDKGDKKDKVDTGRLIIDQSSDNNTDASRSSPAAPSNSKQTGFTTPDEQGDTSGYPDITTGGPSQIPSDSTATSLDKVDYQYSQGNNPHPMEGTNLNEVDVSITNRNYTPEERELMAKTLAGEIDQRYTDLNSEEGFNEVKGILSTMENRDLANGPKTISDAINAKLAYSTWNTDEQANVANTNYEQKKDLFDKMVNDYLNDPNSNMGFTNYLNKDIANPSWANNLQDVQKIGPHTFGVDESISNKITKGPLSEEQKNTIATDIVNQNFKQGFAYPASEEISSNTPAIDTTGVQTSDMANGMQTQRDYVGPVSVAPSTMAQGLQAQRDYVAPQQITENAIGNPTTAGNTNPVDTINNQVSMDNGFTNSMGQQISSTAPSISTNTMRSLPTSIDIGGQVYTPNGMNDESVPTRTQAQFEQSFYSDPSNTAESRMPGLAQSSTGVYGNPTEGFGVTQNQGLGFGDYVATDPNASQGLTSFGQEVQEARINDQVTQNNQSTINAGMDMASTAPTVSTAESVASQTAASDPTSAGAGTNTSSVSSGVSTGPSGGFTSTHDATTTDTSTSTTGTTGTTTSTTGTTGFADIDSEGDDGY